MRIRVLGSAAGGGCPQWNCGCSNCRAARAHSAPAAGAAQLAPVKPRTQECVAVSADGSAWFLLNASPEIRSQIESFEPLHPRGLRHSPIAGIILTNGDLDHTLGLLCLRESHPLFVYATEPVRRGFVEGNVLYRTLQRFPGQVSWRGLQLGVEVELTRLGGGGGSGGGEVPSGLTVEAFAVPGKLPVHLEGLGSSHEDPADNVGLLLRDRESGRSLLYASAVGELNDRLLALLDSADCAFLDGTFWSSDELIAQGLGDKRAESMAHLPIGGEGGSLALLASLRPRKRFYIHLNNTNPILREDSPERAAVLRQGFQVAHDGLEVTL